MKIALLSYAFAPSVGGIETVSAALATELRSRGHQVLVVTQSPGPLDDPNVVRQPGTLDLIRALRSVDVVVQSHPSLRLAWPLVLRMVRRPWVVVLHTPLRTPLGRRTMKTRVAELTLPRRSSYAVSRFMANMHPRAANILPNPYDDAMFVPSQEPRRPITDLLFVGRLVRAKGLDVLLRALKLLNESDTQWTLTVVGDGVERDTLEALSAALNLTEVVSFRGRAQGKALAAVLAEFELIVVPSRAEPPEAFGLVPLEALGVGTIPVAANIGGLPEAVGRCGYIFPPEDPEALARTLREIALKKTELRSIRGLIPEHLDPHRRASVATAYELAMERTLVLFHSSRTSPKISTRPAR